MVPYEDCRVAGPNYHKDFYFLMEVIKPNGKRTGVPYHRYLMELYLGRYLEKGEVVHHIDGDNTNNSLDNLQVMSNRDHGFLHHGRPAESFTCPTCGIVFSLKGRALTSRKMSHRSGRADSGPFCSKSCSNSYTSGKAPEIFKCIWCLEEFQLKGRKLAQYKYNAKNVHKNGPFCSKSCASIFNNKMYPKR